MKKFLIVLMAVLFLSLTTFTQDVSEDEAKRIRARYTAVREIKIPEGTKLAELAMRYKRRLARVPVRDVEDKGPYPLWYRAYLRDTFPGLPTRGHYQYPRVAAQILEWMIAHPNFEVPPRSAERGESTVMGVSRTVSVGGNINISNINAINSESFIAVDYSNPKSLVAGSNNLSASGTGRQRMFWSTNGGASWNATELPLAPGTDYQSDPAVAWTTDGTAWAATLGIGDSPGKSVRVQIFKSTDKGANWSFVKTISTGNNNDKELMWIDTHSTSPHKDNIYVAWDVPGGGMRFARSTDKGATWSAVTNLSSDAAIGAHLATGPSGELYVAWPEVITKEIRMRKSTDGGATFGSVKKIATTNDAYEVTIPAMCIRNVLIYVSIGADRSNGPRKGWVYAAWTDRNGTAADPGCSDVTSESNANIYFSRSIDGGNTWSTPKVVHTNPAKTDQFNQWLDVDPDNGVINVIFYDTRDDPGRKKTHVYYIRSEDGGDTWIDETRVTTAETDETTTSADLGNQYGDYNGLVAYRNVAHPVWTDRRVGVPGGKEQIFTVKLGDGVTITLSPAEIKLDEPGKTAKITATVKDRYGSPKPGLIISFKSEEMGIAKVTPASSVTNNAGIATATVEAVSKGETEIQAEVGDEVATVPVEVPTVSFWGLLLLSLAILLVLKYRRRQPEA